MPTHSEALEYLKELEDKDIPREVLEALETSEIRKVNTDLANKLKELEPQAQELARLKRQPKVEKALREFGVDVQALNKRDKTIVENHFPEFTDEPEREQVAEFLTQWDFEGHMPEAEATEQPAAAAIVNQSISAPLRPNLATQITPKDFASWDMPRQRRFIKEHPDAYESLKRGQPATGVTG